MTHHIIKSLAVLALGAMLLTGCYFFQQSVRFDPLCASIIVEQLEMYKNNN